MNYSVGQFVGLYGEAAGSPAREQWQRLVDGDLDAPLTVVNLFALREVADARLLEEEMSGQEAFIRYTQTSVPKVASVGGRFLVKAFFSDSFMGEDSTVWDIVAIAQYPSRRQFLALLSDEEYREAYTYRQASIDKQNVWFVDAA